MLQKLGDHIANCLARASDAEQRAAEASDQTIRLDNEKLARGWRHLASSYQFVESLERFLLDAEKAKGARQPDRPIRIDAKFPPPGTAFDPDAIAVLTAAYNKAIEGQPAFVHDIIAKCIIELAAEGERDPDRLFHGVLTLSMRQPRSR